MAGVARLCINSILLPLRVNSLGYIFVTLYTVGILVRMESLREDTTIEGTPPFNGHKTLFQKNGTPLLNRHLCSQERMKPVLYLYSGDTLALIKFD